MPKFTYKLRATKPKGATIQLVYSYGTKQRLRYSTGLRLQNEKNWNSKDMKIKSVIEEIDSRYVNEKLNEFKDFFEKQFNILTRDELREPTNQLLTEICDVFFNKRKAKEKLQIKELLPFFDWFIEHYKTHPLMSNGKPLKAGTAKTYKNAYNLLKRFNDEEYSLTYDTINIQFYNDLLDWFYVNNYSTNYIGTQIKILKTILNAAFELGHHNSIDHRKKYFKKPTEEINHIYLSTSELNDIYDLDLNKVDPIKLKHITLTKENLNRARDLFLISANTGLRVSDFNKLEKRNIIELKGKKYFKLITEKLEKPVTIPINAQVQNILNKRDGNPPESMPDQHINYALKEIGRLAEINSEETIERTSGGVKTRETKLKYELITNHTGRRSFCSNAYLSGMPTIDIMVVSSHSTEKIFYNYIKLNDLQKAIKISEHNFFK